MLNSRQNCLSTMKAILFGIFAILVVIISGFTAPQDGSKITTGVVAKQGDFPFVVSIHNSTDFLCGGVLINVFWVLTSAICVWNDQFNPLKVSVGGVKHSEPELGRYDINVASITFHDYVFNCTYAKDMLSPPRISYYFCNNLALLKLIAPVIPSVMAQPITLPASTESTPDNTLARVAGWGSNYTSTSGAINNILQSSNDLLTMRNDKCVADLGINVKDYDFCTWKTGQVTCEYDHGGPLFKFDSVRGNVLIGIVNYASCGSNFPDVYVNVTTQRWWINKIAGV